MTTEIILGEIRDILNYQTKLLESLVESIDINRHSASETRKTAFSQVNSIMQMLGKHPAFQTEEAKESLKGLTSLFGSR